MLRTSIRKYSVKNIPYEAIPKNKYNQQRSAFNLKPVPTNGLVYNPPVSIVSPKSTPKAFLPPTDPRLTKLSSKYKTFTKDELADFPLIHGYAGKTYDLTPEIVEKLVKLRIEDPKKWTVSKLAKEFNIDQKKVNVITAFNIQRKKEITEELDQLRKTWSEGKVKGRMDRKKRVLMWLRNDF